MLPQFLRDGPKRSRDGSCEELAADGCGQPLLRPLRTLRKKPLRGQCQKNRAAGAKIRRQRHLVCWRPALRVAGAMGIAVRAALAAESSFKCVLFLAPSLSPRAAAYRRAPRRRATGQVRRCRPPRFAAASSRSLHLPAALVTRVARKGGQWSDHFEWAAAYHAWPHETVHGAPEDVEKQPARRDPAPAGQATTEPSEVLAACSCASEPSRMPGRWVC